MIDMATGLSRVQNLLRGENGLPPNPVHDLPDHKCQEVVELLIAEGEVCQGGPLDTSLVRLLLSLDWYGESHQTSLEKNPVAEVADWIRVLFCALPLVDDPLRRSILSPLRFGNDEVFEKMKSVRSKQYNFGYSRYAVVFEDGTIYRIAEEYHYELSDGACTLDDISEGWELVDPVRFIREYTSSFGSSGKEEISSFQDLFSSMSDEKWV